MTHDKQDLTALANIRRTLSAAAQTLDQLVRDAWSQTEEAFRDGHPGRYLILESTSAEAASTVMLRTVTVASVRPAQERALLDVVPVVKRHDNNPFTSMITIGRARNNDIVVNDSSVSKMHAWIRHGADTSAELAATLTDAGSTNGTFVDGAPVVASTVPLHVGTRVRLGSVEFWFVDGLLLHRALRRRARNPGPDAGGRGPGGAGGGWTGQHGAR
jgi:hypothetical protein